MENYVKQSDVDDDYERYESRIKSLQQQVAAHQALTNRMLLCISNTCEAAAMSEAGYRVDLLDSIAELNKFRHRTPAQSLADHDRKVIEDALKYVEELIIHMNLRDIHWDEEFSLGIEFHQKQIKEYSATIGKESDTPEVPELIPGTMEALDNALNIRGDTNE